MQQLLGLLSAQTVAKFVDVVIQEMVRYLQQEGHLEGQGGGMVNQPPNLNRLISLLQHSQVCPAVSGKHVGCHHTHTPKSILVTQTL